MKNYGYIDLPTLIVTEETDESHIGYSVKSVVGYTEGARCVDVQFMRILNWSTVWQCL